MSQESLTRSKEPRWNKNIERAEQANLATSPCWLHDTACWCWVCCQLHMPNTIPAQETDNSPAKLVFLPNLQRAYWAG